MSEPLHLWPQLRKDPPEWDVRQEDGMYVIPFSDSGTLRDLRLTKKTALELCRRLIALAAEEEVG